MKALKIIGIILIIIVFLLVIATLFLPSEGRVSRSITVSAPQEIVFQQVNNLRNWEKWSPWLSMDSTMKVEYGEKSSGEGAFYSWTGEKIGNGKLTIVKSMPFDEINNQIEFEGNGTGQTTWTFKKEGDDTEVTWAFYSKAGFNPMARFMNMAMDKIMGPVFEGGLQKIKELAESAPDQSKVDESISIEYTEKIPYIGMKATWLRKDSLNDMGQMMGKMYGELSKMFEQNNFQIKGVPLCVYHDVSADKVTFETGLPVGQLPESLDDEKFTTGIIKGGKVVKAIHRGDYNKLPETHKKVIDYIKDNSIDITGDTWEMYITDPGADPNPDNWITYVYYKVAE